MKIVLNKATSDCTFVNLSPIFTIFHILANNDIVDISHDLSCHGNLLAGNYVTIVTKIGILLNWLLRAQYMVHTTTM